MSRITHSNDAYGHELWAYLSEGRPDEIVERDDGLITCGEGPKRYFSEFSAWAKREQRAMRFTQGSRALDVGCGAGRVSLYLQRQGMKVTAIDRSPLAIRLCRKRGVQDARLLPIEQIHRLPADSFDTVVMFGNNFGLFGSYKNAKRWPDSHSRSISRDQRTLVRLLARVPVGNEGDSHWNGVGTPDTPSQQRWSAICRGHRQDPLSSEPIPTRRRLAS